MRVQSVDAEFARIAIHRPGCVALVVQTSCGGVDAAWAAHQLARRTGGGVVFVEAEVLGTKAFDRSGRFLGTANCLEHCWSNDAVHWCHREHVEAAKPVVNMNDRGYSDKYPPTV